MDVAEAGQISTEAAQESADELVFGASAFRPVCAARRRDCRERNPERGRST